MASSKNVAEFPDIEAKLQKPAKKSVFERQKEEAEAKRQREEAETAAVLEDFCKSFDRGDDRQRDGRFPTNRSGPGSLGPAPTSYGRKRPFDAPRGVDRDGGGRGRAALDEDGGSRSIAEVFDTSEDEDESMAAVDRAEEKAVAKPTLRLSNMPPATSPAVIKALVSASLTVESVKILPPAGPGATERKSTAAIVTLAAETPATDIDSAVSALQNHYLGFGFYLSLHRHLSSAAMTGSLVAAQSSSTSGSQPFGAKPVPHTTGKSSLHPPAHGRGFAPPTSYNKSVGGGPVSRAGILHVPVHPPRDIKQLRMIHMVVEEVLKRGHEFEALLMSRPEVQREERWAWIWDARSEGGIWYRYRLWEVMTGAMAQRDRTKFMPLFEGSSAWKLPEQPLSYEYTTHVDEFVSDSEYNSSDDDEFELDPGRTGDSAAAANENDETLLSPLKKAKLTHLLARLPTTIAKLRKGDIARVATFAITHASRGVDEIVDLVISNVERPFAFSLANPEYEDMKGQQGTESTSLPAGPDETRPAEAQDTTTAKLIGLYVVSDILSTSSTSGLRHAWRYRQQFEAALRSRKVFEGLGLVPKKMDWGRLRAEKWRRSIAVVLDYWESWCVFSPETHAFFRDSFKNPPALMEDDKGEKGEKEQEEEEEGKADEAPKKGKWKTVDAVANKAADDANSNLRPAAPLIITPAAAPDGEGDSGDGSYVEYTDDEELDLEILDEEDIDGEPLVESQMAGLSMADKEGDAAMADTAPRVSDPAPPDPPVTKTVGGFQMTASVVNPKKRMRAMDMFAGSDSEKD
ncbi:hypothetical protein MAPG_06844 [Magnaporthiopsis poae ATCC 64411]|uniref:CID domain-containing protein n=1 Tax=Magnaporthiopsis poae (strain ATCC 64411 / 73-15) TaxID=644358 RepID=A0A0C4E352_MAGP6|nr:hypothetical protein MAPG_06844 [Magnaporthiopsis poae ATCC 64411]